MLSLILLVVILFRVIYCIKKKKNIFYFSEVGFIILLTIGGFFITTYLGMITYIRDYDRNVESINYYKNKIIQLESQSSELDTSIEDINSNFELSKKEKDELLRELTEKKEDLELQINLNNNALNELPLNVGKHDRRSLYKFLLYFGH